jgi:hypothetical protein
MFHDIGRVIIPAEGTVPIFQYRFPCNGVVRHATLRLQGVPRSSRISVIGVIAGEEAFSVPWDESSPLMRFPANIPVDEYTFISVRLARVGGEEEINVGADIAYLFQEQPRAQVQHSVR